MRNSIKSIIAVTLSILLVVIVGSSFKSPKTTTEGHFAADSQLSVFAKVLNQEESQRILQQDIMKVGVQPIQLIVHNATAEPMYFSVDSFPIKTQSAADISKKLHKGAKARGWAWRILGLVFWPGTIAGIADTSISANARDKILKTLNALQVKQEQIPPFSTVLRVAYASGEDLKQQEIKIKILDSRERTFHEFPVRLDLSHVQITTRAIDDSPLGQRLALQG